MGKNSECKNGAYTKEKMYLLPCAMTFGDEL